MPPSNRPGAGSHALQLLAAATLAGFLLMAFACGDGDDGGGGQTVTTASGLQYVDLKVGDGASPQAGQTVVVHYTGTLENGTKFDSSRDRGQPYQFVLGAGQVIQGWDEGVATMKVGGTRRLTIPPQLAYGETGAGDVIPANATLIFEIELLEVR